MNIGFSEKQMEIFKFPYKNKDALICDGAVRSGKTICMALSYVLWAMSHFNNQNFIIAGKTFTTAKRNIIEPLLAIQYVQNNFDIEYKTSAGALIVKRGSISNTFYIYGGADESSYMRIQGITSSGVLLDEVALMPRSFVEQAMLRCSVEGSKYWFNCNPADPYHWFYLEWILQSEEKNAIRHTFYLEDNPSLSEKTKEKYYRNYTGVFFDRYILGKWVQAEGLIYPEFANDQNRFIEDIKVDKIEDIYIGVDFGGNKSSHTFVATAIVKNGFHVLKSEKHAATGTNSNDIENLFINFVDSINSLYNINNVGLVAYCDSASPTLINGLIAIKDKLKIDISIKNSIKKPIMDRIQFVGMMFSRKKIKLTKNCESLVQALSTAVFDSKSLEDKRLDNGTTDIDSLDAFEYSIEKQIRRYSRCLDD